MLATDCLPEFDLFGPRPAVPIAGKRLPIPPGVSVSAVFGGENDCFRYRLVEWVWDRWKRCLTTVMMNPSCADQLCSDRTLAWVHAWAVRNGFGRLIVVNSHPFRAADSRFLANAELHYPENDRHVLRAAAEGDLVVLGYGQPRLRKFRDCGPRMARLLHEAGVKLHVWSLSLNDTPMHPLYLPHLTTVTLWRPPT